MDNFAPLSLAVYSIYFKANAFDLYFLAMQQVWLMYYSFNRRHYDKAPLVWLANIAYWQQVQHPLYTLLRSNLHVIDEYPVENFHSLLRARTNEYDTPEMIRTKACWIDDNKHELQNFSTWFVPPEKRYHEQQPITTTQSENSKVPTSFTRVHLHPPIRRQ